jgi:hypothetical protein
MRWLIWAGMLPLGIAAWTILRRVFFQITEELHVDRAREQFRLQREWLEARFLTALVKNNAAEGERWQEHSHWRDEVVWARDRHTRRLLALIGVHFDNNPYEDPAGNPPRHATALFEYRKGRWHAEGKRLDQVRPDEAFRQQRFEPLVVPQRRG